VHLGDDEVLSAVDSLDDTLAAARAALESLAAAHLSFQAQLRVHRASTRQARAWVQENVGDSAMQALGSGSPLAGLGTASLIALGARSAPDETDEILRHTLGVEARPVDVGPEGADDALLDDTSADAFDDMGDDGLVDDDLGVEGLDLSDDDDDLVDVDSLVQFTDEDELLDNAATISDEDEDEDEDEALVADEDEADSADEGLVEIGADNLVSFDDGEDDEVVEVEVEAAPVDDDDEAEPLIDVEDDDSARYVVYEEPSDDAPEDVVIGLDGDSMSDDDDPLLSGDSFGSVEEQDGDPDSTEDLDQLAGLTETDDLVTLGGDEDDFDIDDDVASVSPDREQDEPVDATGDSTLVADLESLVRLQDMIAEDEAPGAAHGGEREGHRPEPRMADPVRVTTTLTDDDLDRLGFASTDQLVAPEGADADPNSETGSRPAIRVGTPEGAASAAQANTQDGDAGAEYTPPAGSGASVDLGASLPTIRDQQPGQSRPTAAAIRIDPSGGGRAVQPEEDEALALGGAPDDEDEDEDYGDSGFSLDVEEYEIVDDDDGEDVEEILAQAEPEPPPPIPTLSADQETHLLRQAAAAYDRGELPVAADLYSDILDFNPDNGQAALGRGRVYLDLGDYARAMSDFTVAEDLLPEDPDVHAAIGELYYARKDYQRAIDYFDEALEHNDRHAMAWCRRGIAHYYRKDYERAYKDLVKAQKLDDSIPNIRTYIGMVKKKRR